MLQTNHLPGGDYFAVGAGAATGVFAAAIGDGEPGLLRSLDDDARWLLDAACNKNNKFIDLLKVSKIQL